MKSNKTGFIACATVVVIALALGSCQKEKLNSPVITNEVNTEQNIKISDDVYNQVVMAKNGSKHKSTNEFSCKTVTVDSSATIRVMTIDFGTGCSDLNGNTRSGKIIIDYLFEDHMQAGNRTSVRFDQYVTNGNAVAGTVNMLNNGLNANNNITISTIFNLSVTQTSGNPIDIDWSLTYESLEGGSTENTQDDKYALTGTARKLDAIEDYDATILQPLIKFGATGCNQYFVQGEVVVRSAQHDPKYIDYGNGTCDNLAVETVNGVSQTIILQ